MVVTTVGDSPRSRSKVQRPEARALDLRLADLYCRGGAFVHLDGLWWCLCGVNGAARSTYALVSAPSPLLPKISALVLRRAPKRADPDQPNALTQFVQCQRLTSWCLCEVNGAARSTYTLVSALSHLLPKISALVLRRAPKRADPDQPNALTLCSVRD